MKKSKLSIHNFMNDKLENKLARVILGGAPGPVAGDPPPSNGTTDPIGPTDPGYEGPIE